MKPNYYKELDGVRAIAALMVMLFHFFTLTYVRNSFPTISKIAVFGQTGVSLFFVLSGFLITRILIATKSSPDYFSNFYVRRSLRIFPLYYVYLAIYYFLIPVVLKEPSVAFDKQVYYWVYLQNFAKTFNWDSQGPGHFWSLAVEEHFYLFWPCLIFFLNNKKIIAACISIVILAFICRLILINLGYEVFYFTFCRIDELAIGALLAVMEIRNKLNPKNSIKFLLLLGIVLIPAIILWVFFTGSHNGWLQVVKFMLLSFTYFSIVGYIISIKETNPVKKLLQVKSFLYSGKISYGLYVYHPICYWIVSKYYRTSNILFDFFIMIAVSYVVATASFYLFERHFLKMKRFFEYKKKDLAQPAPALHDANIPVRDQRVKES